LKAMLTAADKNAVFAVYGIGGMGASNTPETLSVLVETAQTQVWIALADYGKGSWRWFNPPVLGDVAQVDLTGTGTDLISPEGNTYIAVAAYGANLSIESCHLATSGEAGLPLPQATLTERTAGAATLKVWSDGPPSGAVSLADLGPGDPALLPAGLEYASDVFEVTVSAGDSPLTSELRISTADSSSGAFLATIDSSTIVPAASVEDDSGVSICSSGL
jgi:hypothetical protein